MAGGDGREEEAPAAGRLKVFISYSRRDVSFAEELELALRDKGFEPLVDRHDIDAGEEWKARLGQLIFACDTVVFVLTETSAGSPICAWEVEEAVRLGKRLLVVTPGAVPAGVKAPPQLAGLNWIHCWRNPDVPGSNFTKGALDLERALKVDLGWLRQQTRLSEQAELWFTRVRTLYNADEHAGSSMLLRGNVLEEALAWARSAPTSARVPELVEKFLRASEEHEAKVKAEAEMGLAEREKALKAAEKAMAESEAAMAQTKKAQRRVRFVSMVALVIGVVLSGLALVGGWFAATNYVNTAEMRSALLAREANTLFDEGFPAKAMLMALYGDPSAQAGPAERLLRPQGYVAARSALVRGMTSNRLAGMFDGAAPTLHVAFDPSGERFLSGHADGKARLWRLGEDRPIATFDTGVIATFETGGEVLPVAFHPDGERFLTGSGDGKARLWRVGEDKPLATVDGGGPIFAAAFHPDGERFMTGARGNARQWRIGQDKPVATFAGEGQVVLFHPDGERFLVEQRDQMELRRFGEDEPLARLNVDVGRDSLPAFHPDGERVLVPGRNGDVELWRFGALFADWTKKTGGVPFVSPRFLPDGERFLTSSEDNKIRLWAVGESTPIAIFDPADGVIASMALHPDGKHFLSGTESGRIMLWRLEADRAVATMTPAQGGLVLHPDGERFLTFFPREATLWRMGEEQSLGAVAPGGDVQFFAMFDQEGKRLLTGDGKHKAKLWRLGEDKPLAVLDLGEGNLTSASFLPDGDRILAAVTTESRPTMALLWRIGEDMPMATFEYQGGIAGTIAALPDGQRFLTGSEDGVRLWNIGEKAPLQVFDRGAGFVGSIALLPDGKRFLTASDDGKARLWRIGEDKPLAVYDPGGAGWSVVTVFPDGERFLTGSDDGHVRLWRLGEERPLATFHGERGQIVALAVLPDGEGFMAASQHGKVSKWRLPEAALADTGRQVEMACTALKESGVMEFSDADYDRFPILDREAPHPCAKVWGFDPRVKREAEAKEAEAADAAK